MITHICALSYIGKSMWVDRRCGPRCAQPCRQAMPRTHTFQGERPPLSLPARPIRVQPPPAAWPRPCWPRPSGRPGGAARPGSGTATGSGRTGNRPWRRIPLRCSSTPGGGITGRTRWLCRVQVDAVASVPRASPIAFAEYRARTPRTGRPGGAGAALCHAPRGDRRIAPVIRHGSGEHQLAGAVRGPPMILTLCTPSRQFQRAQRQDRRRSVLTTCAPEWWAWRPRTTALSMADAWNPPRPTRAPSPGAGWRWSRRSPTCGDRSPKGTVCSSG